MSFTIEKRLTPYNFTDKNSLSRIKYIVIHYFGSLGSAAAVANYFKSAYRGSSAHYALDEGNIVYQCVEDEDIAWHCGTSGTYYHPECRNSNSIGIEVRPYCLDKSRAADASYRGWYFTPEIEERLLEFTKYLMKKYNIDADHVIRHYDVTHKYCPRPWMGADENLYYHVSGDIKWAEFKAKLAGKEPEEMTDERVKQLCKEYFDEMRKGLRDNDSSAYSEAARKYCYEHGIIEGGDKLPDGTPNFMWEDFLTREQFCTLLYRALEKLGELDKCPKIREYPCK